MKYRAFGNLQWKSSVLGFGVMRLPVIDGDTARIDEPEATRMIRYAIDHGVNYVDTAYPYHQQNSERFLGRALQDGYRERIKLATKMPSPLIKEAGDFDRYLNEQLERLQTDHIDFYLFHGLNKKRWLNLSSLNVLGWAESALADGRFRHLGFSFHDSFEVFEEIIDSSDLWTLCQIQYNYMDEEYQAGTRGLRYAAARGLAVVVMEPIRGGRLARSIPPAVQKIWDSGPVSRTPADLALQWVWDHPEVAVVLSGMSTIQQVKENLASADQCGPGTLTEYELAFIAQARDEYRALCPVPCTNCQYCLPCPNSVNIPRIFEIYNDLMMYSDKRRAQQVYSWLNDDERAEMCLDCGECLDKCPQQIEIPVWLKQARSLICQDQVSNA
jgi:predicted aldo/keto reductase-like oxidoreductase